MEALIHSIRAYIGLSAGEEAILSALFTPLSLKAGAHLLEEGKVCRHVAFIESGLLRYYMNEDGDERTFYFSKENEFVCNYQSFLTQIPSDKSIQALEDTLLYIISYEKLQLMYQKIQQGERFGRLAIEQVFVLALQQVSSLYRDPPQKRYEQFLELYPDLVQRIPQYYIASYVGIRPQSLSRIRKRNTGKH